MPAEFLDTNILVYLAAADPQKRAGAKRLLADGGVASVQVLNEFATVARRKLNLDWPEVRETLKLIRSLLEIHPVTAETHETGLDLAQRHGFHVYDAMIVAAALIAGCDTLWSEDMHDGLLVAGRLRILNPFRAGLRP